MTEPDLNPTKSGDEHLPEAEHRHHRYRTNAIPWFVHLIWVGFWILAIWYVLRWLIPEVRDTFSPRA
jgi:hypothetical protein